MTTQPIERALLASLRARKIKLATVSFSGGNDDGGCDDVKVVYADDTEAQLSSVYIETTERGGWHKDRDGNDFPAGTKVTHFTEKPETPGEPWRHYYRKATVDEVIQAELVSRLCAPVEARYGSWAGDFSAHGTLTYRVPEGMLEAEAWETSYTEVGW